MTCSHVRLAGQISGLGVQLTCGMDFWSGFVDFRMDGKGSGIDRLVTNHYAPFFIHKNQIRHADLGEVHRQRVEPFDRRQS